MNKKKLDTAKILETYLTGMKASVVELYIADGNKMKDSARRDLEEIHVEQIFISFSPNDIKRWILVNKTLSINTHHEYSIFQASVNSALLKNDNPQLIKQINRLTQEEKEDLKFCFDLWEAVSLAFYNSIKDIETIKLLLKYNEQLRLVNNSLNSPDETRSPNAYQFDQSMQALSKIFRERKKDLISAQIQKPGIIIAGTLATTLHSEDWIKAFQQLSSFGYLDPKYLGDTNLIENWIYFALSFEKEETHRSLSTEKLLWTGTPLALAEFLIKLHKVGCLSFSDKDRTALYSWIDNTIEYSGKRDSLIVYFKSKNLKSNCFSISVTESGKLNFEILAIARKVKK